MKELKLDYCEHNIIEESCRECCPENFRPRIFYDRHHKDWILLFDGERYLCFTWVEAILTCEKLYFDKLVEVL